MEIGFKRATGPSVSVAILGLVIFGVVVSIYLAVSSNLAVIDTSKAQNLSEDPSKGRETKQLIKAMNILDLRPMSINQLQSLIQEVRQLALQNKRLQATQRLKNAILTTKLGSAQTRLRQELSLQAKMFYLNDTQVQFELGESLFASNPQLATEKYQKGLELEPNNIELLKSLIRSSLVLKNCGLVNSTILSALAVNPFDFELQLLKFWGLSCGKNILPTLDAELEPGETNESYAEAPYDRIIFSLVSIEILFNANEKKMAQMKLKSLMQSKVFQASPLPEVYFWALKLGAAKAEEMKKNYGSLCSEISAQSRRNYKNYPYLCTFKKAVEAFIPKSK